MKEQKPSLGAIFVLVVVTMMLQQQHARTSSVCAFAPASQLMWMRRQHHQQKSTQNKNRKSMILGATEKNKDDGYFFAATRSIDGDVKTEPSSSVSPTTKNTNKILTRQEEIRCEANDALASVGWSMPTEGELTSDDPFVKAIDAGIQRDFGVPLDELLNPAKVVNLERDLYVYRIRLAELTGTKDSLDLEGVKFLKTEDCDGGGGGEQADQLRKTIAKKEADLTIERRSVFRGWLKNIFLTQAIISFGLSYVMATNPQSLFGNYDWYYSYNMDVSIQVLGYWWWWLFVVPSLRSRRPKGIEKKALDIAFLGTPLISLIAPVFTKDTAIIWFANFLVVAGSYAFAYTFPENGDDDADESKTPAWVKFLYKSLDFGSGRERGARQ